jgi:outer membrane lipoprotein-sorting protein
MSLLSRRGALCALAATLLSVAAPAAAAPLSAADQALVAKAQAYLQGISSVRGRFTQTDPRGSTSSGDLFIKRPGKARFAYDAPKKMLIVSDGAKVSVYDARLKTFNSYPLGSTPLSLFLARDIKLEKGVDITEVTRLANGFAITARDNRRQTRGWITLAFSDSPVRLTEWTITDAQGARTRVQIPSLQAVAALDAGLFELKNPLRAPTRVGR